MFFSSEISYKYLGAIDSFEQEERGLLLKSGKAALSITVITAGIIRVKFAPEGDFRPRRSWAVTRADQDWPAATFSLDEGPDTLVITTEKLKVQVQRDPCRLTISDLSGQILVEEGLKDGLAVNSKGGVACFKAMPADENYYGFGERTSLLNKRGRRYRNWNRDPVDTNLDHGPGADNLYQSIPFFMALRPNIGGYGLFLNNTYRSAFDMDWMQEGHYSFGAESGDLDYYFLYGPEPATIVQAYTELSGRTPLPPRWALGYQQCRWSYYPESQVLDIARQLRQRRLPADTIVLDIDYMDGYRVFSWDRTRFPDPKEMNTELAQQGFKVVAIIDPGVKFEPEGNYKVFEEGQSQNYFICKPDGEIFTGYVWPGLSVFPDFVKPAVREWWGNLHKVLLDSGVRGIWNDMNEPAISSTPFGVAGIHLDIPNEAKQGNPEEQANHAETHNLYGYLESRSTYEGLVRLRPDERPFVLTRSGFAGIQRYAAVWMGDNSSLWEHLEMSMPQLCGMGLSGVPFVGVDIGGFWESGSAELFARWIELGAFYPFSRGHSAEGTPQKEPWVWGEAVEAISRKYLELRYRLLPYLYTLFWEHSQNGSPVFRPLFYHFWEDATTLELHDQVLLGEGLMLAPVYRPGMRHRTVYLPAGEWYDWWSGQSYQPSQGQTILQAAPLDSLPMFVRGGTILPLGPVMQYSDEKPLDRLTLEIFPDAHGWANGQLYEDDGLSFAYQQGQSCLTRYGCRQVEGKTYLQARRIGPFEPASRTIEIRLHLPDGSLKSSELTVDSGDWEAEIA